VHQGTIEEADDFQVEEVSADLVDLVDGRQIRLAGSAMAISSELKLDA
jgi:hypothetical protein